MTLLEYNINKDSSRGSVKLQPPNSVKASYLWKQITYLYLNMGIPSSAGSYIFVHL